MVGAWPVPMMSHCDGVLVSSGVSQTAIPADASQNACSRAATRYQPSRAAIAPSRQGRDAAANIAPPRIAVHTPCPIGVRMPRNTSVSTTSNRRHAIGGEQRVECITGTFERGKAQTHGGTKNHSVTHAVAGKASDQPECGQLDYNRGVRRVAQSSQAEASILAADWNSPRRPSGHCNEGTLCRGLPRTARFRSAAAYCPASRNVQPQPIRQSCFHAAVPDRR
jgi:hypothetical protein